MNFKSVFVVLFLGITLSQAAIATEGRLLSLEDQSGNSIRFFVNEDQSEISSCSPISEGPQMGLPDCQSLGTFSKEDVEQIFANEYLISRTQYRAEIWGSGVAGGTLAILSMYALNGLSGGSLFAVLNTPGLRGFVFNSALISVGAQMVVGGLGAGAGLLIYDISGRNEVARNAATKGEMLQYLSGTTGNSNPVTIYTNDVFFAEFKTLLIGQMSALQE